VADTYRVMFYGQRTDELLSVLRAAGFELLTDHESRGGTTGAQGGEIPPAGHRIIVGGVPAASTEDATAQVRAVVQPTGVYSRFTAEKE
jgi:hypothetical protein